jgi:hypothetical protein
MDPVGLHEVPVENLKSFLDVAENKLDDNWHWCSKCDTYDQCPVPKQLSPEAERLSKMIEYYSLI